MVVDFAYPWLSPRCNTCMKWGRLSATCVVNLGKTILKRLETERDTLSQVVERRGDATVANSKKFSPSVMPSVVEHELTVLGE